MAPAWAAPHRPATSFSILYPITTGLYIRVEGARCDKRIEREDEGSQLVTKDMRGYLWKSDAWITKQDVRSGMRLLG